jgi:hypothetical protein
MAGKVTQNCRQGEKIQWGLRPSRNSNEDSICEKNVGIKSEMIHIHGA